MKGKSHLSFGVVTGATIAACLYPDDITLGLITSCSVVLGNLFPDIDNRKSIISNKFKISSKFINKLFGHRGFLHSPIFVILITLILSHYTPESYHNIVYSFAAGLVGHLFLDMLTTGGIPLLFPFYTKRFRFVNIKSGSRAEPITLFIACTASIILIVFMTKFFY